MDRQKKAVSLYLSEFQVHQLEALAKSLNCTRGDKGNLSKMLQRISEGDLVILSKEDLEDLKNTNTLKLAKEAVSEMRLDLINYVNSRIHL